MLWAVTQQGVLTMIGMSLAVIGALVIFAGIQRTRFRAGAAGPGVVQVHEGLVTYCGPFEGGTVSVDALASVKLDPKAKPTAEWVLAEIGGGPSLRIPTNAQDAEILFDVFAALDGIRTENMLSKLRAHPGEPVEIWNTGQRRLH